MLPEERRTVHEMFCYGGKNMKKRQRINLDFARVKKINVEQSMF